MSKLKNTLKLLEEKINILICIIIVSSITGFSLPYLYKVNWIGLGEDKSILISEEEAINLNNGKIVKLKKITEQIKPGKTVWDWIGLLSSLAIPIFAVTFPIQYQRNEQKKAEQQAKLEEEKTTNILNEEALQAYIDRMSELLIDKNLKDLPHKTTLRNAMLKVARARTLSILRRLNNDRKRKESVIRFLIDAGFITELNLDLSNLNLQNISLVNANLSNANLSYADLSDADLNNADLSNANLSNTNLSNTNLSNAKLDSADLSYANLSNANLDSADLSDANLTSADLRNTKFNCADLSYADLTGADIEGAILLNNITSSGQLCLCSSFWENEYVTPAQIEQAHNWDKAIYSPEFRKELGLPPKD